MLAGAQERIVAIVYTGHLADLEPSMGEEEQLHRKAVSGYKSVIDNKPS